MSTNEEEMEKHNSDENDDDDDDDGDADLGGCIHYRNRCEILAPCCQRYFKCFRCHDEAVMMMDGDDADDGGCDNPTLDRKSVTKIRCVVCKFEQTPSDTCQNENCSVTKFADYVCLKCSLYRQKAVATNTDDDHPGIYHCDDCGICRIGKGLGISHWHCHTCCSCLSLEIDAEQHKKVCRPNASKADCSICFMPMHDSLEGRIVGHYCGHHLHKSCFDEYVKTVGKIDCPICFKPLIEVKEPTQLQKWYAKLKNSAARLWTVIYPFVIIAVMGSIGIVDSFCMDLLRLFLSGYIFAGAIRTVLFPDNNNFNMNNNNNDGDDNDDNIINNNNRFLLRTFFLLLIIHFVTGIALYGFKIRWFD